MLLALRSLWESATATVKDAGGIASAEAFGQPSVTFRTAVVGAGGIPSGEAFGADTFSSHVALNDAGGITSAQAFGQPAVTFRLPVVGVGGIASAEAFGQPTVTVIGGQGALWGARPAPSAHTFKVYNPFVVPAGRVRVRGAGGIASEEAFGLPIVISRRAARARRREEELVAA